MIEAVHENADQICFWIATLAPLYLVLRHNFAGVCIGALIVWFSGIVAGEVSSALDPEYSSILGVIWILLGWVAGLVYCLIILIIKRLVIAGYRAISPTSSEDRGTTKESDFAE